MAGYLAVDDVRAAADERRYTLPDGAPRGPRRRDRPDYTTPLARMAMAFTRNARPAGRGLPHRRRAELGRDGGRRPRGPGRGQPAVLPAAAGHRVLPALPEVDAALRAGGRVADVGCGMGWSSIGMALGYPEARVDGFDVDVPSVEHGPARTPPRPASPTGSGSSVADAGGSARTGSTTSSPPSSACTTCPTRSPCSPRCGALVRPGGTVLVVDERVAETFTAPGDDVERLMYGYSLTCCLPDAHVRAPSVGTGTVMRPSTLAGYARRGRLRGGRGAARRARLLPLLPARSPVRPPSEVPDRRKLRNFPGLRCSRSSERPKIAATVGFQPAGHRPLETPRWRSSLWSDRPLGVKLAALVAAGAGSLTVFAVITVQALHGTGETADELLASAEATEDVLLPT